MDSHWLGGRPLSSSGPAFLSLAIIGSGIAASRLSQGDQGFTLVVNAIATGLVLVAIILALGSVSGGQLNPAVTVVAWMTGALSRSEAGVYAVAQLGGAIVGALVVNLMFGLAAIDVSQVLVSSAVKDPVAGSGLQFEDDGEHELKGFPDHWRLYRVLE